MKSGVVASAKYESRTGTNLETVDDGYEMQLGPALVPVESRNATSSVGAALPRTLRGREVVFGKFCKSR